jgi:hypothetical protein
MYATGTEGLDFQLINGGDNDGTYRVRKGEVTTGEVHIPAYHRLDANSEYLSVTEIGSATDDYSDGAAFFNTSITAVYISAGITSIGRYAFTSCTSLAEIAIPESVTFIGEYTFQYCSVLASITLPASITTISDYTFYNSGITSITIPASVTSIGFRAFMACTSLTDITVDNNNPNYASEGGILYNKAKTTLIQVPGGISGNVAISEGVTSINDHAFFMCYSLTAITIPVSVTYIGFEAFRSCDSLNSITIPASVTYIYQAFSWWSSSQTIYIQGHASEADADMAWGVSWRNYCEDTTIKYLQSDGTYQ